MFVRHRPRQHDQNGTVGFLEALGDEHWQVHLAFLELLELRLALEHDRVETTEMQCSQEGLLEGKWSVEVFDAGRGVVLNNAGEDRVEHVGIVEEVDDVAVRSHADPARTEGQHP